MAVSHLLAPLCFVNVVKRGMNEHRGHYQTHQIIPSQIILEKNLMPIFHTNTAILCFSLFDMLHTCLKLLK